MKLRYSKKDKLSYRTVHCPICNTELIRSIENPQLLYISPSIITHCKSCNAKYSIKWIRDKVRLDIININKRKSKPKINTVKGD